MDNKMDGAPTQFLQVTERALIQRINRKLAEYGEKLCKTRSERDRQRIGEFYVINTHINGVIRYDESPERLGREIEVLRPWEKLAD